MDSPIAVRDFPEGCVRIPRREFEDLSRTRPTPGPSKTRPTPGPSKTRPIHGEGEEEDEESSRFRLPSNFCAMTFRDQFSERRELYSRLSEHYQRVKDSGQLRGFRPDLQVMRHMNEHKTSLDSQTPGSVPGVEVGDSFAYRTEMYVVGLHRQVQGGIAWIDHRGVKKAVSVVVSGGYRDDIDLGDTITYTGQGGNNYKGDKRQLEDQTPERGNEALINSCKYGTPVRVIRGHGDEGDWNKIYCYDGLYNITSYKHEAGRDGYKVYTFLLKRLADQAPLDIKKWRK